MFILSPGEVVASSGSDDRAIFLRSDDPFLIRPRRRVGSIGVAGLQVRQPARRVGGAGQQALFGHLSGPSGRGTLSDIMLLIGTLDLGR